MRLKFPNFATYLAISLRSCQSKRKLRKEVVNFMPNFVGKLRSSPRAKFVVGLVISLQMNLNKVKTFFNQATLILCLLLKCRLFEAQTDSSHADDESIARLASGLQRQVCFGGCRLQIEI